jgi:outer membrane protein OmpA-like peptidoglycan-associated protein
VEEKQTANLQVQATDPTRKDIRRLDVRWTAAQGRVTPEAAKDVLDAKKKPTARTSAAVFDATGLTPGKYTVTAEVADRPDGDKKQLKASCSAQVTVEKDKKAPTITCEGGGKSIIEGESTALRAKGSDANNDALTYSWTVDGQAVTNDRADFTFGSAGKSLGDHTVRVTVKDVDGMTASCDMKVTVNRRPNRNPSVSLSLDKTEIYPGDPVTAKATGSDPDGDKLTYSWTADGQARPETGAQIQVNTGGLAGGSHRVAVSVKDDRGATASDTKAFSVREKTVVQVDKKLDNIAKAKLDEIALKMQQDTRLKVTLSGYTDDREAKRPKAAAGMKRAELVKTYLVKQHAIDAGRIETRDGGAQAIADNATEEGRKQNKRVEIELFVP